MSYTVLARRYRSGTFDEVIGQEHVAQTLKKAIASGRIAHAYLFCGTRGTGKTSTARILAKALNCHKADAPTTEPCGQCASCLAVARGEDIDVIEIDAASNTGVDNVRDIIENSQYRPANSRFKVYIIDEVHMLSKSAFNALLKTLEEPPSHVKFILATTEPEKVLPTILSRCQRYDFRNISTREIAAHLKTICKKEKIKSDDDALLLVAKAGAGSMRDALSLLDRLLSLGEDHLTVEMVEQLLGLPKSQLIFDLAQAIGQGDVKQTLTRADAMIQAGLSVDSFIVSLVDHLRNLLILRTCGKDSDLVEVPGMSLDELLKQAQAFDPVAVTQDITILEDVRRTLRQTQAGRALLDATLVRLALADQFTSIGELLGRVEGDAAPAPAGAQKKKPEPIASNREGEAPAEPPAPARQEPRPPEPRDTSATPPLTVDADDDDDLPRPGKVWETGGPSVSELLRQQEDAAAATRPASAPETANIEPVDPGDLPAIWHQVLEALADKSPSLHALVIAGTYAGVRDESAVVQFPAGKEFAAKQLERNGKKDMVREAFATILQQKVGVRFEVLPEDALDAAAPTASPPESAPAPAQAPPPPVSRAHREPTPAPSPAPTLRLTPELKQQLEADPLVRAVMTELNGGIIKVE